MMFDLIQAPTDVIKIHKHNNADRANLGDSNAGGVAGGGGIVDNSDNDTSRSGKKKNKQTKSSLSPKANATAIQPLQPLQKPLGIKNENNNAMILTRPLSTEKYHASRINNTTTTNATTTDPGRNDPSSSSIPSSLPSSSLPSSISSPATKKSPTNRGDRLPDGSRQHHPPSSSLPLSTSQQPSTAVSSSVVSSSPRTPRNKDIVNRPPTSKEKLHQSQQQHGDNTSSKTNFVNVTTNAANIALPSLTPPSRKATSSPVSFKQPSSASSPASPRMDNNTMEGSNQPQPQSSSVSLKQPSSASLKQPPSASSTISRSEIMNDSSNTDDGGQSRKSDSRDGSRERLIRMSSGSGAAVLTPLSKSNSINVDTKVVIADDDSRINNSNNDNTYTKVPKVNNSVSNIMNDNNNDGALSNVGAISQESFTFDTSFSQLSEDGLQLLDTTKIG